MLINNSAPRVEAWDLLRKFNISTIPINIYEICSLLNIEIKLKDLDSQGIFILKNGVKRILLNKNIQYESRKIFTVAHEIGHYIIPGHENIYRCSKEDIEKYQSNNIIEREANEFAAELLMPENFFNKDVDQHSLSLKNIQKLSQKYFTSLSSTAIKFIKNTKDIGAIVLSENGYVVWYFKSEEFPYSIIDGEIDASSYVYGYYNSSKEHLPNEPHEVPCYSWLEDDITEKLYEQSIPYADLNMVLTLITLDEE